MTFHTVQIRLVHGQEHTVGGTYLAPPRSKCARPPSTRPVSQRRPPSQRQPDTRRPSQSQPERPSSQPQRRPHSRPSLQKRRQWPTGVSCIVEEDATKSPEVILAEIATLQHSVEEHSFNFYGHHSQVYVRRKIGMTVIEDIVENSKNVQIVAQDLRDDLRDVAIEPDDLGWIEHLYQICQTAARVRRKMSNHGDEWFFEPWDDAMLFPRVTANGQEMKGPQYN